MSVFLRSLFEFHSKRHIPCTPVLVSMFTRCSEILQRHVENKADVSDVCRCQVFQNGNEIH